MLTVNIICIGKIKEKYFTDAINEYSKRLSAFCKFNITELDEEKLPQNPSDSQIEKTINAEGERILSKLSKGGFVISMCIEGKQLSSVELADKIGEISVCGKSSVDFVIGGSYGLSEKVKQKSDFRLSMSKMTFPHQMARMILCEQIYRAFQILSNGKYHK